MSRKPKILVLDIETAPLEAFVWALHDQYVGVEQIKKDWVILSWAAKWLGTAPNKLMYKDIRHRLDNRNDAPILDALWKLLDAADIIITQNGKSFDQKKINARFILNGYRPPSSYKHIDTKVLAKKHFGFTSNGLEYMTDKLCTKYKKLKHKKFPGLSLWVECLKGNQSAWKEMERYNKHDVLATEELYSLLQPWDSSLNFTPYYGSESHVCSCGSIDFMRYGFAYTGTGKFQRYQCKSCGSESRDRTNLFSKEERKSLKAGVAR